jgi:hypothetical protein
MGAGERVARISHMRPHMPRLLLAAFAATVLLVPATASAVTVDEIVALSRAGVTDTVILALIDRDKTIFTLEPDQLVALKAQGLSEPVILAMLKSGREEGERAAQAASDLKTSMYLAERSSGPEVMMPGPAPDAVYGQPSGSYGGYASTPGYYGGAAIAYPLPYATAPGYRRARRSAPVFTPFAAPSGSTFIAPANIPVVPPSSIPVIPPVSWPMVQPHSQTHKVR